MSNPTEGRNVQFDIVDWRGTWAELEAAIDKFAADNGVELETVMLSGSRARKQPATECICYGYGIDSRCNAH